LRSGDLAAELEAALIRNLRAVEEALPQRPARPAVQPASSAVEPVASAAGDKPRSRFAPPLPDEARTPRPQIRSPAHREPSPPRPSIAPDTSPARAGMEASGTGVSWQEPLPETGNEEHHDPAEWYELDSSEMALPPRGPMLRSAARPMFAAAILMLVVIGGGAILALQPGGESAGTPTTSTEAAAMEASAVPGVGETPVTRVAPAPMVLTPEVSSIPETPTTSNVAEAPVSDAPVAATRPPVTDVAATTQDAPLAFVATPPPATPQVSAAVAAATGMASLSADSEPAISAEASATADSTDLRGSADPEVASADTSAVDEPAVSGPAPKRSGSRKGTPHHIVGGSGTVTMSVNMRSGPDNKAKPVKILNAGSRVRIVSCNYWCEVVADGDRGFVFNKFIARGG